MDNIISIKLNNLTIKDIKQLIDDIKVIDVSDWLPVFFPTDNTPHWKAKNYYCQTETRRPYLFFRDELSAYRYLLKNLINDRVIPPYALEKKGVMCEK